MRMESQGRFFLFGRTAFGIHSSMISRNRLCQRLQQWFISELFEKIWSQSVSSIMSHALLTSALEYSQIVLLVEDLAFTWQVFRFIDSLIPWWSEVESGGIVVAVLSSVSGEIKARSMVEELPLGTWRVGSLMTWYKKKLEVTETNLEYKVLLWLQKSILKSPTKIKFVKKRGIKRKQSIVQRV